jgi:SAM-dependent methyltransferase
VSCAACLGCLEPLGPCAGYRYAQCLRCGSIQLDPLPTRDELAAAYRDYAGAGHYEPTARAARRTNANNFRTIVEALCDHAVRGPVLDYGSGWGGLVEQLREHGFEGEGLDWNEEMVASCLERGLPVTLGDLEALDGRRFAALTLSTVFEHLVDHDAWLERACAALEPGGLLVSLQPTARFARLAARLRRGRNAEIPPLIELYAPPWHTAFFSIDGMRTLLDRHGFDLVEVRFTRSGRKAGVVGLVQATLERVNRIGWRLAREHWPLQVCHTFVFRKRDANGPGCGETSDPPSRGGG